MSITPEVNRKRVKAAQAKVDRVVTTLPKGAGELIEGLGYIKADFCRTATLKALGIELGTFLQESEDVTLGYDGERWTLTIRGKRTVKLHFDSQTAVISWARDNLGYAGVGIGYVEEGTPWDPIYLVDVTRDNEFNLAWYDDEETAIRDARRTWGKTSAADKRSGMRLELRRYTHNIEVEEPENFDYDIINWEE